MRNLVEFILRAGDIDNRRGAFGEKDAMQEGSRIHRKIQGQMGSGYQAEVPLSMEITWPEALFCCDKERMEEAEKSPAKKLVLTVEGRADGIFKENFKEEKGRTKNGRKRPPVYDPCEFTLESPAGFSLLDAGLKKIAADQNSGKSQGKDQGKDQDEESGKIIGAGIDTDSEKASEKGPEKRGRAGTDIAYIDEIKGIYRDVRSLEYPLMLHLAQAKCYAYIYGSQKGLSQVGVQMTYCNLGAVEREDGKGDEQSSEETVQAAALSDSETRNVRQRGGGRRTEKKAAYQAGIGQIRRFRHIYRIEELKDWFMKLVGQYRKWAKLQIEWKALRQESIRDLPFPFPWRPGQKDVASSVYRTIVRGKKLFIQAPTGTGKTLSTIYPAVKAIGEGKADRLFYATAKTITRTVAEESFAILREKGLRMKTVTLTAKEKICFLEETECNPDACPYAKGHYDRVNDAVFELISENEALDRQTLEAQARKWQVCPFEMGLDTALWADAVICDYNYIFDPRARLKRFFGEGVKGDYLFLIDEAHNLVERGREMFSASLYLEEFLALRKEFQAFGRVKRQKESARSGTDMQIEFYVQTESEVRTGYRYDIQTRSDAQDGSNEQKDSNAQNRSNAQKDFNAQIGSDTQMEFDARSGSEEEDVGHDPQILSRHHRPGELLRIARDLSRAAKHCIDWLEKRQQEMEENDARVMTLGVWDGEAGESSKSEMAALPNRIPKTNQIPESRQGGIGVFPVYLLNLVGLMEDFMEDSLDAELNEKTLNLYFQIRSFLDACEHLNDNYVVYTERLTKDRFLLRAYCMDISENLQECLDKGIGTIFFSATFLPINYYKSLLSTEKDNYAIYANPIFDPARRLVLIGTDTSSRYRNRNEREYRKMAEYILEVLRARRGNYMVFFSSYQMMDDVADQLEWLCSEQGETVEVARQISHMSEEEREAFLEKFEHPHPQGLAGFCVMGGIFGEGIDLREDRLIGAVIVGAGLPQVCSERELLKRFYDRRGEDGFFYAYLCPGMNRVLQSAGRVIRTEQDAGLILLLDERFAQARYRDMFPREWEHPEKCTLRTVREKAETFWEQLSGEKLSEGK